MRQRGHPNEPVTLRRMRAAILNDDSLPALPSTLQGIDDLRNLSLSAASFEQLAAHLEVNLLATNSVDFEKYFQFTRFGVTKAMSPLRFTLTPTRVIDPVSQVSTTVSVKLTIEDSLLNGLPGGNLLY